MKRVLVSIALFTLALATSAVFGSGQKENATASTGTSESQPIELTYWGWGPHVTAVNSEVGPAFNKLHPNVTVKAISMGPFDLMDKFYVSMASGQGLPDAVQLIRRLSQKYLKPELLYDFSDFMSSHKGQFVQSLVRDVTAPDGKVLGIPLDYGPSVVYYYKPLVEKLGIDVSKIVTWADYLAVAQTVSRDHPDIYVEPLYYPGGSWGSNYWKLWAQSAGGNIFDDQGKVIRNNQQLKQVTEFYYKLHTTINVLKAPVNDPSIYDTLRAGKLLFWPKNSYESSQTQQQLPELKGKISSFAWPLWSANAPHDTGNWGGVALVVPLKGPNAKMAAEFEKFFATSQDALTSLWFLASGVPSYAPARESILKITDRQTFTENLLPSIVARDIPTWNYIDWAQTEKIVGDGLDSMFAGQRSPDQAWDWIESQLISGLGR